MPFHIKHRRSNAKKYHQSKSIHPRSKMETYLHARAPVQYAKGPNTFLVLEQIFGKRRVPTAALCVVYSSEGYGEAKILQCSAEMRTARIMCGVLDLVLGVAIGHTFACIGMAHVHKSWVQPEPFVNNSPALFLLLISCLLMACADLSDPGMLPVNQPCSQNSSSLSSLPFLSFLSFRELLPLKLPRWLYSPNADPLRSLP
jgi:hypothetical protein